MNETQTLGLANSEAQNKVELQVTEFREHSLKDESIVMHDLGTNSKQLKQSAQQFLNGYSKIDQTFPINTLRESNQLKVKYYKESTYYGDLHHGKKQGLGIMVYKNGRIYEGQWFQDQKKGYGAEKFPNGCVYKGQYLNGKPGGTGTYIWSNGERYDGQWHNGLRHGSGMWRGHRGDSYKGEWRFGKPEGYGVHTWPNGDTYEGEFKQCLKHGQGIDRFANGDLYKGGYVNGKPSGYGEYYWFNASYFKGNFVNGLRDGNGLWKRNVGASDRYQGNYRNDKKWGYGVFTWASGNVYKGNYEADMRNGYGQMFWTNGSYYKGNWVNGIQHGQGQIYVPSEGYKKGIFSNNNIVEVMQQKLIQKTQHLKAKLKLQPQQSTKEKQLIKIEHKGLFRSRDNSKFKKSRQKNIRHRIMPKKSKEFIKQKLSVGEVVERQRMSQQQKRVTHNRQDGNQFFSSKNAQLFTRNRINTFTNGQFDKNQVHTELSHNSRERLLHSSFYLYKLNQRHNFDTLKNLKKLEVEQNSKASILFMGKLYPQSK